MNWILWIVTLCSAVYTLLFLKKIYTKERDWLSVIGVSSLIIIMLALALFVKVK